MVYIRLITDFFFFRVIGGAFIFCVYLFWVRSCVHAILSNWHIQAKIGSIGPCYIPNRLTKFHPNWCVTFWDIQCTTRKKETDELTFKWDLLKTMFLHFRNKVRPNYWLKMYDFWYTTAVFIYTSRLKPRFFLEFFFFF